MSTASRSIGFMTPTHPACRATSKFLRKLNFRWCAVGLSLTLLSACAAQKPLGWLRIDGRTVNPQQFEVDRTICRGETQKAGLAAPRAEGLGQVWQQQDAMSEVFIGCMAQRGYTAVRPE